MLRHSVQSLTCHTEGMLCFALINGTKCLNIAIFGANYYACTKFFRAGGFGGELNYCAPATDSSFIPVDVSFSCGWPSRLHSSS